LTLNNINQEGFLVFSVDSIIERQSQKISEVSDLFGLSDDEAHAALRYFKWNLDKMQNEWFEQ
jgi:hypothetical protein